MPEAAQLVGVAGLGPKEHLSHPSTRAAQSVGGKSKGCISMLHGTSPPPTHTHCFLVLPPRRHLLL